jgi:hypothetical protein
MSESPRVEFDESGYSMSVDEAVEKFRVILESIAKSGEEATFRLGVVVRPCDCDSTLENYDEYCPIHGERIDNVVGLDAKRVESTKQFLLSIAEGDNKSFAQNIEARMNLSHDAVHYFARVTRSNIADPRFRGIIDRLKKVLLDRAS